MYFCEGVEFGDSRSKENIANAVISSTFVVAIEVPRGVLSHHTETAWILQ